MLETHLPHEGQCSPSPSGWRTMMSTRGADHFCVHRFYPHPPPPLGCPLLCPLRLVFPPAGSFPYIFAPGARAQARGRGCLREGRGPAERLPRRAAGGLRSETEESIATLLTVRICGFLPMCVFVCVCGAVCVFVYPASAFAGL